MDTGRLILNENNREEISHFNDKTIPEFIEIKNKLTEFCKELESETIAMATLALELIDKNGIDIKSFSAGHFPNHLKSIQEGRFNPNNKTYHQPEDIKINKTARDGTIIEAIVPELLEMLRAIYKKFEKKQFYEAFLKNITPLSLLNTVSLELTKIQKEQNILSLS